MKTIINKIFSWFKKELIEFFSNFSRDIRSLRSILNWIYCFFYLWLVHYCVKNSPASMDTAIVTTGSVVSIIFTSYVFSKSYEKTRIKINADKKNIDGEQASD